MKKKINGLFLIGFLSLMAVNLVYAGNNSRLILINEKKPVKSADYSSVICFHIKDTENLLDTSNAANLKDNKNSNLPAAIITLRYTTGEEFFEESLRVKGYYENGIIYGRDLFCFSAKPGTYDLICFKTTIGNSAYSYVFTIPINRSVTIEPGKMYYFGEINLQLTYTQPNSSYRMNYIMDFFNNESLKNEVQTSLVEAYPKTYQLFKDNFVAVNPVPSRPLQPVKTIFKDDFNKSGGLWQEQNDETQHAYYQDDQFYLESKSGENMAAQWISLPEKYGDSFEVELKSTWVSGEAYAYGLLLLGDKYHYGYVFGISSNGQAGIWYLAGSNLIKKDEKQLINLVPWRSVESIAKNGSGVNSIRIQVLKRNIVFFVNDQVVAREPANSYASSGDQFNWYNDKTIGVFSYGKQLINFNELTFSKFK